METITEVRERFEVLTALAARYEVQLQNVKEQLHETKEVLDAYADAVEIAAEKEKAALEKEQAEQAESESDMTEYKVPTISEKTDLSFTEAKDEYAAMIHVKDKAAPPHGWATWVELKIEQRLTFLRQTITDFAIAESEAAKHGD